MKVLDFFKNLFRKSYAVSSFETEKTSDSTVSKSTPLRFYKSEEFFSIAVDSIAKACYVSGYRFKPIDDKDKYTQQKINLVKRFFKWHVNEKDTFNDLLLSVFMDLLTFNNAYLEKVKQNKGWLTFKEKIKERKFDDIKEFPMKLYYIPADTIRPVKSEKGRIISFKQIVGDTTTEIEADRIVHFKMPTPGDTIEGRSPVEVLKNSLAASIFAAIYNAKFFENNATPRLHFDLGEKASADAVKQFAARIEKELKGKFHRNIVTAGGVKINPISITNKDMEFAEYMTMLRERIFGKFNMQPIIAGIPSSEADIQLSVFKTLAVKPLQMIVADRINKEIMFDFFPEFGLEFIFNPVDILDEAETAKVHEIYLKSLIMTINEVRAQLGLAPVPWGDSLVIPWSEAKKAIVTPKELKEKGKGEE